MAQFRQNYFVLNGLAFFRFPITFQKKDVSHNNKKYSSYQNMDFSL